MILVWGIARDGTTASVLRRLERRQAPFVFLDQHRQLGPDLLSSNVEIELAEGGGGTVTIGGEHTDLSRITAVYLRPYDALAFPVPARAGPGSIPWAHALALTDLLWCWAQAAPGLVVNRPRDMATNGSKPFQARQIRREGFAVPETLVTTDAGAADAFWRRHGQVIYKSISGTRSVVSRLAEADRHRWRDIGSCPVQFQQYVPGTDFRAHVIGDAVFGARIDSDLDDYRYASRQGGATRVVPVRLPSDVEERGLALTRAQGLVVSGIDLRRTPDGDWYCFEANPSPAFSFFDRDERIADALAALLHRGQKDWQS